MLTVAAILEASMSTLQEGQLLLERIREMGVHADVQNRHATTAACYGIEHLLELLQDRRRHLEELWLQRRIRLEQCLQLLLLDHEVGKVSTSDILVLKLISVLVFILFSLVRIFILFSFSFFGSMIILVFI